MVIQLLQSNWLWGLLGLLVPIAIHLLYKRSRRVVLVGSLHAFRGGTPVQASSIRLNELWLLLLRCLLLTLFVLLLAQPMLVQNSTANKQYVFIAPELATVQKADSLQTAGYEVRLLQPGLPHIAAGVEGNSSQYSYWDVFREINQLEDAADTVRILFRPTLNYFSGSRPLLSKIFEALPVHDSIRDEHLAAVLMLPNDQRLLQWWDARERAWKLRSKSVSASAAQKELAAFSKAAEIQQPDTLSIIINADTVSQAEARMWQQGLQLLDSLLPLQMISTTIEPIEKSLPRDSADVRVWLSAAEPPMQFNQKQQQLRLKWVPGTGAAWFVRKTKDFNLYSIQHRLSEQQHDRVVLANFIPELLAVVSANGTESTPPILLAKAQWQGRSAPNPVAKSQKKTLSLEWWVWGSLLFTFMMERWLSLRK